MDTVTLSWADQANQQAKAGSQFHYVVLISRYGRGTETVQVTPMRTLASSP